MCLTVRGPRPVHPWLLTPPVTCCCCPVTVFAVASLGCCPRPPHTQPATKKKQRLDVDGSAAATGGDSGSTTIFCGNLPWSATEEQISALFADCGEVTGVRIGEWPPSCRGLLACGVVPSLCTGLGWHAHIRCSARLSCLAARISFGQECALLPQGGRQVQCSGCVVVPRT